MTRAIYERVPTPEPYGDDWMAYALTRDGVDCGVWLVASTAGVWPPFWQRLRDEGVIEETFGG